MPNFKLEFGKFFEDQDEKLETGKFTRIVIADNLQLAERIAKAMVGEEIYANECLTDPVTVTETEEEPEISSWNEDETWKRIIENMGLSERSIEFIFNSRPKVVVSVPVKTSSGLRYIDHKDTVTEKVGIRLKKN